MCNFLRENFFCLLVVNAEKRGANREKCEGMTTCYRLVLCVASLVSPTFTVLHFLLLLCQSCCSLRNVSLCGRRPILGLIKSSFPGWLSVMTSSEVPLFCLASGPPNINVFITRAATRD